MKNASLRNKVVLVLSLFMVLFLTCSICVTGARNANAENELQTALSSFEMQEVQQLRTDDKGMRFVATISVTQYEDLIKPESEFTDIKYGYFIMPKYYEKIATISEESTFGQQAKFTWDVGSSEIVDGKVDGKFVILHGNDAVPVRGQMEEGGETVYMLKGSVIGIYDQNLAMKYTARMYVEATKGGNTYYAFADEMITSSSMVDVAIRGIEDNTGDVPTEVYQGYINSYKTWYNGVNGQDPTYSYTINYLNANDEVVASSKVDGNEIGSEITETAKAPDGYILDSANQSKNVLTGKVYADNNLTLKVYVKATQKIEGNLYNKELYHFSKDTTAENYEITLPVELGDVTPTVKVAGTAVNATYDNANKKLTIPVADVANITCGDTEMILDTADVYYTAKVTVADRIINNAEEFMFLQTAGQAVGATPYHYILIGKDIDGITGYVNADSNIFRGTLDGKGHVISNFTFGNSHALFSKMTGTLKNIAFVNMTYNTGHGCAMIANEAFTTGKVDNVFISGTTNSLSIVFNAAQENNIVSNSMFVVNGTNESKLSNNALIKASGQAKNCYVVSNYTGGIATTAEDSYAFDTESALISSLNQEIPEGFNSSWSINEKGVWFGGKLVVASVSETKTVEGEKNNGELFYFSKDVATPTGYASTYVENGYYKITMPESFTETTIDLIKVGNIVVYDFSFSAGMLKLPTALFASAINGDAKITIYANNIVYTANVTVADNVLYDTNDVISVLNNSATLGTSSTGGYIILDGDITWDANKKFGSGWGKQMYADLDGKGYAIIGMKTVAYLVSGLNGNTIKNIAFLNVQNSDPSKGFFSNYTSSNGAIIQNVAVTFSDNAKGFAGLIGTMNGNVTMTNTVVVCNSSSYGYLDSYASGKTLTLNNTYCITASTTSIKTPTSTEDAIYTSAQATVRADFNAFKTETTMSSFNSGFWKLDDTGLYFGGDLVLAKPAN